MEQKQFNISRVLSRSDERHKITSLESSLLPKKSGRIKGNRHIRITYQSTKDKKQERKKSDRKLD